jgi:anti-anti-sigma factor
MSPARGVVRVYRDDQALIFQVEGRATMAHSPAVRRLAEQSLARGVRVLRVDLRHSTYLDSTFLGTLLVLKRTVDRQGLAEFTLVCPSPECERLLEMMGLNSLFASVTMEEPATVPLVEFTGDFNDVAAFRHDVMQAHQELASLPGSAGAPFRAVTRCLEQSADAPPSQQV